MRKGRREEGRKLQVDTIHEYIIRFIPVIKLYSDYKVGLFKYQSI